MSALYKKKGVNEDQRKNGRPDKDPHQSKKLDPPPLKNILGQEKYTALNVYIYWTEPKATCCPLEKPTKCVQYVHSFDEICLSVYTFTSASILGVV
jgi:hypothetical protein